MAVAPLSLAQLQPLVAATGRLRSIAYNSVGIQTEAGAAPYTRVVNAGGASGLSLGVFQNDFKQQDIEIARQYAQAVLTWNIDSKTTLSFTQDQFANALKVGNLTVDMQAAAQSFGSTSAGATWIHNNLDVPHLNAAVAAAERAFATPYGQAVLAQDEHVEEFAAFAMKVFNQYGPGKEGARGTIGVNGFASLLDYLEDGSVKLKDNSPNHAGQTKTVEAKNPDTYDLGDLKAFAETYSQTRAIVNPAVVDGPMRALASGGLYKTILDSDSSLTDVLLRAEAKGDFSPAQIGSDPDVAITRAVFGTSTSAMKNAVDRINDSTSIEPVSVAVTLGQYPGTVWIDPVTEKIAITYKASGAGWLVDKGGHLAFNGSQVKKVDDVKTLVVEADKGDAGIAFDKATTPLANAPLHREAVVTPPPIGHWEERDTYTPDLGIPLGKTMVWVPDSAATTTAASHPSPVVSLPTNHTTSGAIYLGRDGTSATLPDGQVINAGPGGRLELAADGNLSATRPATGYGADDKVYSITLYGKGGQVIANTQVQVISDPGHPNDPAYNTTVVQGQARNIEQLQPDGTSVVVHTVFQTGLGWVEPGTGEIVQPVAQRSEEQHPPSDFEKALLDAFRNPSALPDDPGTKYADAGAGSGTVSDAGSGGDPEPPNPYSYTNYLNGAGANLTPTQQGQLAQQLDALHLGGEGALNFITLPGGGTAITNIDGEIIGEISPVKAGFVRLTSNRINEDGSVEPFTGYLAPNGKSLSAQDYENAADGAQASQAASALGLMNSIIGLQNWEQMSDLQRTAAVASIYNAVDKMSGGELSAGLGDLGSAASVLGFLNALDKGDIGGITYSGLSLVENLTSTAGVANSGWVSANMPGGADFLPYLGMFLALESGDPVAIMAAAANFIPVYGQIISICITILGSLLGGDEDLPMRDGLAHVEWDSAGNTVVTTDIDQEGGGATAAGWVRSMADGLQERLAGTGYALVPNLLPAIGFQYDPDGYNLANGARGFLYLKWTDENGQAQTRYYDGAGSRGDGTGETLAGDFMAHAQAAIAPAWAVSTALAHYQQGQGIHLPGSHAGLPQALADGVHQSIHVLTLALPVEPALVEALWDTDGDGYLERTRWVAANQSVLGIDSDGNGLIGAGELLQIDGSNLNSLNWLDANGDRVLDASDPAFAALRLWMDVNSDGGSEGETQSLVQAGIAAIDFGANPPIVIHADGSRTPLTAQAMTGDILGVQYSAVVGGVLQLDEQFAGAAIATLHAVNSRDFDGQAEHIHGGDKEAETDEPGESLVYEGDARLSSTTANTIATGAYRSAQTSTTLAAGDTRLQEGAGGTERTGQGTPAVVRLAQIVSNDSNRSVNGIAFVPMGAATIAGAVRQLTSDMVQSAAPRLFDTAYGMLPLAAVTIGGATVQWPTLATAANIPGAETVPASSTSFAGAPSDVYAVGQPFAAESTDARFTGTAAPEVMRPFAEFAAPGASTASTTTVTTSPSEAANSLTAYAYPAIQTAGDAGVLAETNASVNALQPSGSAGTDGKAFSASTLQPMRELAPAAGEDGLLDFPQTHGEQASGREDILLRFAETLLLANDSTVNAPAFPHQPSLRISSVFAPVHGSVSMQVNALGALEVVFAPELNYHGPASFDYTVTDQYGLSSNARVNLSIGAVNDAPVTVGESASGDEDTTLMFTAASLMANDSDADAAADGDVLRITRVGLAQHGQVFLLPDGTVRFVPDDNYNGPAQFSYWVGDRDVSQIHDHGAGDGYETRATVSLTVLAVNDLPVVTGDSIACDEDIILNINPALLLANDTDVDTATTNAESAQVLTITAVGEAQHGSVTLLPDGTVQFTPERDYFGAASFQYTVDDSHGGQVVGTAVVNLTPVNDAPVVVGETVSFNEDEVQTLAAARLLANDSDVDNTHADLRIVGVDNASHGSVSLNPDGSIRFAPAPDYFGPASFTYTVSDGAGGFTVGTASLQIVPVNDAPRLVGESLALDEDTQARFSLSALLANDIDVDNLHSEMHITAAGLSPASAGSGSVQIVGGEIVFTPALNFNGAVSFTYTVSDGVGGVSEAAVNVTFNPVNDAPVVNSELVFGKRNLSYTLTQAALLTNDTDVESPDILRVTDISSALHGTATLNPDGSVHFTPEAGFAGRGSFDYVVSDPDGAGSTATAQVDFSRINLNPMATDDSFMGYEDVAFSITAGQLLVNDTDADNLASDLSVTAVANAQHGVVSLQPDGSVRFLSDVNYFGEARFSYQVSDGDGGQTWATAQLSVQSVNDAPVIEALWMGRPVYGIVFTGVGVDGPTYGYRGVYSPSEAQALNAQGLLLSGSNSFYQNGQFRPVAINYDDASQDYSGSIQINDPLRQNGSLVAFDPDGDSSGITFSIVASPQHGHVWANAYTDMNALQGLDHTQAGPYWVSETGAWQYYSQRGDPYTGIDYFTMRATDSGGAFVDQVVEVTHVGSAASGGGGGGCCPVVIDLAGDGIELIRPEDSQVFADINDDGWRDRIGWAVAADGVLAFDVDGDHQINRAEEVSFVGYKEGAVSDLEGLAAFDSNADGQLSAADLQWARFGLFRDSNANGRQDPGELTSLDALGIMSISLQRHGTAQMNNGSVVFGTSDVTWSDGHKTQAGDVMFAGQNVPLPQSALEVLNETLSTPETGVGPSDDQARVHQMALLFTQYVNTAVPDTPPLGVTPVDDGSAARLELASLWADQHAPLLLEGSVAVFQGTAA